MLNRSRTWLSLAILCQLAFAGAAVADEEVFHTFELGVFLGAHIFPSNSGLGRADTSPTDLSPSTMLAFGARVGYGWPRLMIEAEVLAIPTHVQREGGPSEFILGYRGQLRLNIIDHGPVQPFIVAGFGGLSSFSSDEMVIPSDDDDFIHGGIGA